MQLKKLLLPPVVGVITICPITLASCGEQPGDLITVTDMLGDSIQIKQNPDKVACVSRTTYDLLIAFGLKDKVDGAYAPIYDNPWVETIYPESKNDYRYDYNESYETFITRNVDLAFAPEKYISDGLKQHGIKALCISLYGNPTFDTWTHFYADTIATLWNYDFVKPNVEKWENDVDTAIEEIKGQLSKHKNEPKKKVFYVRGDRNEGIEYTDTKGSFTEFAFRTLGFDYAGSNLTNPRPSKEQVLSFKPDIFFIGGKFQNKLVEQLKNDSEYKLLDAVKNNQIYTIPVGLTMFEQLSAMTPVFLYDIANKAYPDIFEYDISQMIKTTIKQYFNKDLTDQEIQYMQEGKDANGKDLSE